MYNPRGATIALAFSAALLAESSAFGSVNTNWTNVPGPPSMVTSVAAFPGGIYAATSNGIYVTYIYSNPGPPWPWSLVTNTVPISSAGAITSDEYANLYIINQSGVPQQWNGSSFQTLGANVIHPGTGNQYCPTPQDIAVGQAGLVLVAGCKFGAEYIYQYTIGSNQNWGELPGFGLAVPMAVGASQMSPGAWVVDSTGATWLVTESASQCCTVKQYARNDYVQPVPHSVGVWGGVEQALVVAGGSANGNKDHAIWFWSNPGWAPYYLGGWGHAISVNQYTAVVLAVVGTNSIWYYSLD